MWTSEDLDWLKIAYPALRSTEDGSIEGFLTFSMLRAGDKCLVNPPEELVKDTSPPDYIYVYDTYELRIFWPSEDAMWPNVSEIGGRLGEVAKQLGKKVLDMHQNELDGTLCIAAWPQLARRFQKDFKLDIYIEELLIPYLFAQSHFAKTERWVWGELEHGYLGLIEWLGRQRTYDDNDIRSTYFALMHLPVRDAIKQLLAARCRGHHPCPCGSRKKIRNYHPDVQRGVCLLRHAASRNVLPSLEETN